MTTNAPHPFRRPLKPGRASCSKPSDPDVSLSFRETPGFSTPRSRLWSSGILRGRLLLQTKHRLNYRPLTPYTGMFSFSVSDQWPLDSLNTDPGLCQSPTAWSLQRAKPHRFCCKCWQRQFRPLAVRSHTWPCWCHGWTHQRPGRTLYRWLSEELRPHPWRWGGGCETAVGIFTDRSHCVDLPISEFRHHHDGTKGLLFGYEHMVFHVSEHCGLHEETWENDRW